MTEQFTETTKSLWPRRILNLLVGIAILIAFLFAAFFTWISGEGGRDYIEATLEQRNFAGQTVGIDGLTGSVLGRFEIERLEISGRDGLWLVAEDVAVNWTPQSLISKRLEIKAIRVADLDVLQTPILISGESGGSAIESLTVEDLSLPNIFLADPVISQAIEMQASGQLRHGPDGGSACLSARSNQGDRVETDLDWSPLLVLSGEAEIEGPSGGLLASLLRLNPGQTVRADVTTQESVTSANIRVDDLDLAAINIRRGQSQVSLSGVISPERLPMLGRVVPLLGGQTEFEAGWPLDEDAAASLVLRSQLMTVRAQGRQQDDEIILEEIELESREPHRLLDNLPVRAQTLIATGKGRLGDEMQFSGDVALRAISYRDYGVDRLRGPVSLTFENGKLDFDLNLSGQASYGVMAKANGALLEIKGTYDHDDRMVSLSSADIDLPGLSFDGSGSVDLNRAERLNLIGQYAVDTGLFREGPRAKLAGRARFKSTENGVVADLSGRARSIQGLADSIAPLTEGGIGYEARLRFADETVRMSRFRANNEILQAEGSGTWGDRQLQADLTYRINPYEFASVRAESVEGQATLSGPLAALHFKINAAIETLQASRLTTRQASAEAEGVYQKGVLRLRGELAGDSTQGPVQTRANVEIDGGNWRVTNLDGALGDLAAQGSLSGLGGDISALRGDLILAGYSPLVPSEQINARLRLGDAQVDGEAQLEGVTYAALQDAKVQIIAKGPRESVAFDVTAEGDANIRDVSRDLTAKLTGFADLRQETLSTQADFDLTLGGLAASGAATAQKSEEGWGGLLRADGLGGTLQVALDPGEARKLAFDVNTLSVARLARLLARPVIEGTVSGQGRFEWVGDNIEGTSELTFDDLRSPISDSRAISVLTRLTLKEERLLATMEATEGGLSGLARIEGDVQTQRATPFLIYPFAEPLAGEANLRGEIGPIVEIFLPPQTDVTGLIDTNISFTVPPTPAALKGRIELTDGQLEQGALGLRLKDIALTADLSEEIITVPTLSARGIDGGTLQGSGRMGLGEGTGSVDIQAERLQIIDRREGNAEVSGTLSMSRTTELFRLSGDLLVTDAYINIASLPEPGLPTLEIDFGDSETEENTRSFASTLTEMDLRLRSNAQIRLRGRGLNASMLLDASVTGPFDNPVATGEMSIARGRFDFLGKRFEFRDSSIFLRDDIMTSILSLEAVRQSADLTAVVRVGGTLERPEIDLTSEPNLPEDEVLSRILFGRSPTQLSAIETARLAAALAQLSGGSGFDLFGSLENAVGLDTLEIGQNETGQTQLTTGKYLSDDVYLEVRTAAEGTPGIAVEWQVRDNISVEAETVPNERERLSVQWRKDFD